MANVIQFTIKGTTTGAVKAMEKVRASMARIVTIGAAVGTALIAAFSAALSSIIDVGSQTENLRIRLDSLLGSTQEGGKAFKQMAEFASSVPFAYDEIMESATTLAGVVTGGADEISQWMPIIADLATVSGLSIQESTSQVQRMLSAGAGAADLFRERGVTAMLGFEAGVAVSVEETKARLIEAFEEPSSKFRGASKKMATTWDGVLSMIGDKWFTFKTNVAESGIFNYVKAIAIAFDQDLGAALQTSADTAKAFSDFMIASLKNIMSGVGLLSDMFIGLKVVWKGLEVAFAIVAETVFRGLAMMETGLRGVLHLASALTADLFEIPVEQFVHMGTALTEAKNRTSLLKTELKTMLEEGMPSEKINEFATNVENVFERLNAKSKESIENTREVIAATSEVTELMIEEMRLSIEEKFIMLNEGITTEREAEVAAYQQRVLDLQNFYMTTEMTDAKHIKLKEKLEEQHLKKMSTTNKLALKGSFEFGQAMKHKEFASTIAHGADMLMSIKATNKTAFRIQKAAALAKAIATLPSAVIQSYDNAGGYPWGIIPAGLMAAAGAVQISQIAGSSFSGAAHGGMTNVPKESTYLLQKGERVLSPNQNKDFTSMVNNGGMSSGGSGVSIGTLNIHILENATNAEAIVEMDRSDFEELVASKVIPALDSLDSQGIKPNFASRSDI